MPRIPVQLLIITFFQVINVYMDRGWKWIEWSTHDRILMDSSICNLLLCAVKNWYILHIFHLFEFSLNWSWVVKLGHKALTLDWIWGKKICISMSRNVPDICSRNMLFPSCFHARQASCHVLFLNLKKTLVFYANKA